MQYCSVPFGEWAVRVSEDQDLMRASVVTWTPS